MQHTAYSMHTAAQQRMHSAYACHAHSIQHAHSSTAAHSCIAAQCSTCHAACHAAQQSSTQHATQHTVIMQSIQSSMQHAMQRTALIMQSRQSSTVHSRVAHLAGKTEKTGIWKDLEQAREQPRKACTVLLPVHTAAPEHWSLLCLRRGDQPDESQEPEQFKVEYFDSLPNVLPVSLQAASLGLRLLQKLLEPAQVDLPELPLQASSRSLKQKDGFSCGYWTLRQAETLYRLHRGEGWKCLDIASLNSLRGDWNRWLGCLKSFLEKSEKKRKQEELPELTAEEKQQKLDEAVAAAKASSSNGCSGLGLTPPAKPVQGYMPQSDANYGCPKCRLAGKGCSACNPHKAAAYVARLAAKEEAAKQKAAKS